MQLTQGRLSAALQTFRQGLEFATEAGRRALPAAGVAHVGVAEVLYERNELDAALDQAMRGVELSRQIGYAQWLVTSLTTLARIRQALGDQTGALEAIRRPSDSCRARSSIFSSRWRCSERGCCSPRARWTMPPVGAPSVGWVWRMSRATSTSASTFSLRGCCSPRAGGPGAEVAQVALEEAQAQQRRGSEIEILMLQALALWERDAKERAVSARTGLTLAEPEGYVRTFVDEVPQVASPSLRGANGAPK